MFTLQDIDQRQDIYIYGFGLAGKWLSLNFVGNVKGFIDADIKKSGEEFNGTKVLSIEEAKVVCDKNAVIIVTVIDIQDIISIIDKIPHREWIALGAHLNSIRVFDGFLGESAEFIEYALKTVEDCHKGFLAKDKLFLRSIDLVITERCSLKCKDCSNLMQYYEKPVDITFDEIMNDFQKLINTVDHIYEIRLIGGEPFMNKDIYKIIENIIASPKITKLVVYSNATIPIKLEYVKILKNPKVIFSLTDYGVFSRHLARIKDTLDAMEVAYRIHRPEYWTDSGTIHDFKRTIEQQKKIFSDCCGKNLFTVVGGKIYRCPFAANADRLKAIPYNKINFVGVDSKPEEIRRYIYEVDYLPACNYCKGRSFGSPEITPAIQTRTPLAYKKITDTEV